MPPRRRHGTTLSASQDRPNDIRYETTKCRRDGGPRSIVASVSEYDASRATYTATRRTDPRIAAAIERALGDARTVVNVGAGAGSYEPRDREVTAVEPSATMRAQRPPNAPRAVDARAEALPFE